MVAAVATIAALIGLMIGLSRRRANRGGSRGAYNVLSAALGGGKDGPWPECVGETGDWCMDHIVSLDPDLEEHVFVLPEGSIVTMDYTTERVRIYVDEEGIVVSVPDRG